MKTCDRNGAINISNEFRATNTINLWYVRCSDVHYEYYQNYLRLLTEEEMVRAAKFRNEADCRRFVIARALARSVLSKYSNLHPSRINFHQTEFGKLKVLRVESNIPDIEFNLSHSGDLVVLAVSRAAAVGVDVELVTPLQDITGLSNICMGASEICHINHATPQDRSRVFLEFWTVKEAVSKADGLGLSMDFSGFEVLPKGRGKPELNPESLNKKWWVYRLDLESDYVAAICVQRRNHERPSVHVTRTSPDFLKLS